MGTANISSVGKVFVQGQVSNVNSDLQQQDEKVKFMDIMNQMTSQPGDTLFPQDTSEDTKNNQTISRLQTTSEDYRKSSVKTPDTSASKIDTENVSEKLEEFAQDVKNVLKEEFGITDEQIENAMETLGLSVMDLMNPNSLAELVTELTGSQSVSDLLCNNEFMSVMQAVNELTENLLSELGITMDDLTQQLQIAGMEPKANADTAESTMENATDTTGARDELVTDEKQTDYNTSNNDTSQNTVVENASTKETVPLEENQMADTETALNQTKEAHTEETLAEDTTDPLSEPMTEQVETQSSESGNEEKKGSETFPNGHFTKEVQSQDGTGQSTVFNQNLTENVTPQGATTGMTEQVDVQNIIRQIAEFSKVTIGNAVTTMEMQLNPENLGKIYLEITSKAGVVSAHITAQNETVKEVLETQLAELKQNMNQAGVKVDAVEVTVSSHEFERNLEQNAKQDEQQAEQQEKSAKQTRRINLNDLDELSGIMTEEENLVAQMMAEQGNSVDYTA